MGTVLQDIHFGLRIFRKSPAFVAVMILTIALAIGANTAIFSLINAALLKTIPVRNPEQLVVLGDPTMVHLRAQGLPARVDMFSYPFYRDLSNGTHVFSGILASGEVSRIRVARAEGQESITDQALGALVSGNYFSVLGADALLGRTFTLQEDQEGNPTPVVVISYGFWQEKFSHEPAILGQTVTLNNFPFTVIGVMPPRFYGDTVGDKQDLWVPMAMQAQVLAGRPWLKDYAASWLHLIGRLKPGNGLAEAKTDVNTFLQQQLRGGLKDKFEGLDQTSLGRLQINVEDGRRGFSALRGKFEKPLLLLMVVVGLVLLVACVNVGSLLMVRSLARQREIAVRLSLGAAKWRIIRQLLTESIILSLLGGTLGLFIAHWAVKILLSISRTTTLDVQIDGHVLTFTIAVCMLTGVLFGIFPALRSLSVPISVALKTGKEAEAATTDEVHHWNWGKAMVIAQVGLSLLVLFAAELFIRTIQNLKNVNLGYTQQNLLMVRIDPISGGYKTLEQRVSLAERVLQKISGIPGVRAATYSKNGIFSGSDTGATVKVEGFLPTHNDELSIATDRVGPDYFSVLGIAIKDGRGPGFQDNASTPPIAVINETMARHYFPGQNPIGRKLWMDDPQQKDRSLQIVGVVANAQDQGIRREAQPRFYVPLSQSYDATGDLNFLIRTSTSPETLIETIRKIIKGIGPGIPIVNARSLSERIDESISSEVLIARLTSFFGGLVLVLACIGLYGVMSYTVTRKTRAIGVRMALGAKRQQVLWLVLKEAMLLVGIGIAAGIPLALICSRFMGSMLFQLKSTDPAAMGVVVLMLAGVALLASYLPARRAMNIDPLSALKDE